MSYEMLIPPFKRVEFSKMNKEQAKEYFEWYISQIDKRIDLLFDAVKKDGVAAKFDYSKESLIDLWSWYETKISYRKLDELEYEKIVAKYPDWMHEYISKTELSFETLMYGMDVALYFAKVVIINNRDKVKWGYYTKPKNRDSVNQPVLLGFMNGMDLNPRLIVINCTRRSGREKKSTRLIEIYNNWMEYL